MIQIPRFAEREAASLEPTSIAMFQRADRLVRRLAGVYGGFVAAILVVLCVPAWPFGSLGHLGLLSRECWDGGFGATLSTACLLALTGLAGMLLLTAARQRPGFSATAPDLAEASSLSSAGFAARSGQAAVVPAGAGLTALTAWLLWPSAGTGVSAGNADLLAAFAFAFAFISLVAERVLNAVVGPHFVEAPSLRRLLLLTTVLLALAGCLEIGRGAGLGWTAWIADAATVLPVLVAAELAVRAAARMFLPAPAPDRATAVTDSILATLLTGGPRAPGALLRTHLGLDFTRNWALGYLSAAAAPAALLTCLLCWGLSGLKLIDQDHRGVYERLGAPVAVLGPGLHLLLPWPLGRLRPVELGAIHTVAVGSDALPEAGDQIAADAMPPDSASRLWTTEHATEVNYLVASEGGGTQSFQLVSTEILVLYRIGRSDRDALQAVYGAAIPDTSVREAAARLATRYFGRRTLDEVMGDQPQSLSDALRRALSADVARSQAGVEILAVVIEEIHPPAGAAAAYHMVHAAEINALASIADEAGRATRMVSTAEQESRQMVDAAQASATERLSAANSRSYRFAADRRAYAAGPRSFLLERALKDVGGALAKTPLTLIDHRLATDQAPTFDLRAREDGAIPDVSALAPAPPAKEEAGLAGTFSYVAPGSTADTGPPTPYAAPDATQGAPP